MFLGLERYHKELVEEVAHDGPAIYFLWWHRKSMGFSSNDKLQYIGETHCLRDRLRQHRSNERWWNYFSWENASSSKSRRKEREKQLIREYNPPKNEKIPQEKGAKGPFETLDEISRDLLRY